MTPSPSIATEPSPSPTRARDRVALLGFITATVAVAMLLGLRPDLGLAFEQPWLMVALAVGFAVSEGVVFNIEAKNEAVAYAPSDIFLAVGIVLMDPFGLVASRLIGTVFGMAVVRRPPMFKLAYNASLTVFETALAVVLFTSLSAVAGDGVAAVWFVLVASLSVALASGGLLVAVAISQFEGELAPRLKREFRNAPVLYLPAIIFASSVAVPASIDLRLGVVALAPVPLLWLALRLYGSLLGRFNDLTSVHQFTRTLGDASDLEAIITTATEQFSEHLRADRVALRLWLDDDHTLDSDLAAALSCLPRRADDDSWRTTLTSRPVVRVDELDEELRRQLEDEGFEGGLIAPLVDERGPLGVVALGRRRGAIDVYSNDDVHRLSTMAQQLSVVIRKGHLHEQITFEATHDRLTSLPNRAHFEQRVAAACAAESPAAVLLIDLDRFKQINDTFGHHAGDILLTEAARRIRAASSERDLVARFGGDEFAVFGPGLTRSEAQLLAEQISTALEESFDIDTANVAIGASVGIALMPHHGTDATTVLRCADLAMYDAKSRRLRSRTYRPELSVDTADRLMLLDGLRTALRNRELTVDFQPQLDLPTGKVRGVEALARWVHPELGRIPPDVFIELAEQAGLIDQLTAQVLEMATTAAAGWHADGRALAISVNISAQSILDERLHAIVADALRSSGMDPSFLVLEITESTMMADERQTPAILRQLAEMGISVSVDDFGTGYSSLVNLRKLQVDEIKIDKSFVGEMMLEHDDEVIVRSIIDLGHNLGLRVVAEGVETLVTMTQLSELGCDCAQGYGISRPLPADQFDRWLRDRISFAIEPAPLRSDVTITSLH